MLTALRALCDALERDGDSPVAWTGLSMIFAAMDDRARSGRCRRIAGTLDRSALPECG
jgi:hypothetical protein